MDRVTRPEHLPEQSEQLLEQLEQLPEQLEQLAEQPKQLLEQPEQFPEKTRIAIHDDGSDEKRCHMKEAQAKVFIITLEFGMPQDGALKPGQH